MLPVNRAARKSAMVKLSDNHSGSIRKSAVCISARTVFFVVSIVESASESLLESRDWEAARAVLKRRHHERNQGTSFVRKKNQKFSSSDTLELSVCAKTATRRPSGEGTANHIAMLDPSSTVLTRPVRSTLRSPERVPPELLPI